MKCVSHLRREMRQRITSVTRYHFRPTKSRTFCTTTTTTATSSRPSIHLFRTIKEIKEQGKDGEKVMVKGWIRSIRAQKENSFIDLNDGSSLSHLQIVLPSR